MKRYLTYILVITFITFSCKNSKKETITEFVFWTFGINPIEKIQNRPGFTFVANEYLEFDGANTIKTSYNEKNVLDYSTTILNDSFGIALDKAFLDSTIKCEYYPRDYIKGQAINSPVTYFIFFKTSNNRQIYIEYFKESLPKNLLKLHELFQEYIFKTKTESTSKFMYHKSLRVSLENHIRKFPPPPLPPDSNGGSLRWPVLMYESETLKYDTVR
jgi:hypothetical protein